MDKKELLMGKLASVKVICVRGRPSPPLLQVRSRELITAVETVVEDGTVLPPMIIYKGKTLQSQWCKYLNKEDKDTIFSVSPKGWTN